MTTIAFDGQSIACDTQVNGGGMIDLKGVAKVRRLRRDVRLDGKRIIAAGGAGELDAVNAFVDWIGTDDQYPDLCRERTDQCVFVALTETGVLMCFERRGKPVTTSPCPQAYGSGDQVAMGAMMAGASAKEAVQIAMRLDPCTGGKVIEIRL